MKKLTAVTIRESTVTGTVRDMWMLAFYSGGTRSKDVTLAKRQYIQQDDEGNSRSLYRMGKQWTFKDCGSYQRR